MSEHGTQRTRRWVKIALAVSLALNLAVIGMVAGTALGAGGTGARGGEHQALRALGLSPFVRALPRPHRDAVRRRIETSGVNLREERRAIGRSLRAVEAALRAEPFDRAAVEAAFARSRGVVASLHEIGHGALLDQIETMDAAERAALADGLARAMRRGGARR